MKLYSWCCPDCEEEHEDPEGLDTHCRDCGLVVYLGFADENNELFPTRLGYLSTYPANRRLCDNILESLSPADKLLVNERSRVICEERGWMPRTAQHAPSDYAYRSFIFALRDLRFWPKYSPITTRTS